MSNRTLLISPLERLAYLHTVPLFSRLDPGELLALAEPCFERSFRPGALLTLGDRPVEVVHIIASGQVEVTDRGQVIRRLEERDSLGLLSALAHRARAPRSRALTRVTTLALPVRALEDLLEDRFSIFDSLLRGVCRALRSEQRELLGRPAPRPTAPPLDVDLDDRVDRIIAMQRALSFARDNPVALGQLARRVTPVTLTSGTVLWERDDPAAGAYVLVRGRLSCSDGERTFHVNAAGTCGFVDALAEARRSYRAIASGTATLLRADREALLDVFEDHADLASGCLAMIAAELLDVLEQRASSATDVPSGLLRDTGSAPVSASTTLTGLEAIGVTAGRRR